MRINCVFTVLLLLVLAGCESLPPLSRASFEARLQQQIKDEHFQKAIATIERQQSHRPKQKLRAILRDTKRKAELYRKHTIARAKTHIEEGDWLEAVELTNHGVVNYPSREMLAYRQKLLQSREDYLSQSWRQLNYRRAVSLPNNLLAVNAILAVEPNDKRAGALYAQYRNESYLLLPYVLETAKEHERHEHLTEALEDYGLAKRLSLDKRFDADIGRLTRRRQQIAHSRSSKHEQRTRDSRKKACADFEAMLKDGALLDARVQLNKLKSLKIEKSTLQRYRASLDKQVEGAVAEQIQEGNSAYTLGDIESAIKSWQRASELQPSSSIIAEKLSRAKAFKEYYESLR